MQSVVLTQSRELEIEVSLIEVLGRVHRNDEPVDAAVALETGAGDIWRFKTDEDGFFSGPMMRPERRVLFAHVTAPEAGISTRLVRMDPPVLDGTLELDLELSDRALRGTVWDHRGESVSEAMVRAAPYPAHSRTSLQVSTPSSGRRSPAG